MEGSTDGASLRARVLQEAIALIEQDGLAALSMREVARRARVSHQAPYRHFQDREAILATIAEEGFHELAQRLRSARDSDLRRWVEATTLAYVGFARAHRAHFGVMFRPELADLGRFPEKMEAGRAAFDELRALARASVSGRPREADVDAMATYHWSVVHGLATLMIDSAHGVALGERIDARVAEVARLHAHAIVARTRAPSERAR